MKPIDTGNAVGRDDAGEAADRTSARWTPRFLRGTASLWQTAILLTDVILLAGGVFVAIYLRFISYDDPLQSYSSTWMQFVRTIVFATIIMLGMTAMGLYQSHMRESVFGSLARLAMGFLLGTAALMVLYYLIPPIELGRGLLALSLIFGFVFISTFRLATRKLVDVEALKQRILVVGSGHRAELIEKRLRRRSDRRNFQLVGYVPHGEEPQKVSDDKLVILDMPLAQWALANQIDEIVFGPDDRRGGTPMEDLLQCRQFGINVIDLATFFERETGKVKFRLTDPSWLLFSGGFDNSLVRQISKRAFDITASIVVLALSWPLLLLVALAIRMESGRGTPIFYRQERVGSMGKTFSLIKFRSMRTDAEKDGVARWASKNDNRVTPIGRFIRRTRLDELPQLWNILRGDMSIVGPRPERPEFVNELAVDLRYYNLRHCVRPGLAGWAQLRYPYGASKQDAEEKLTYDLFYVKNNNLLFDMLILIQTFEVVLFGRGAR